MREWWIGMKRFLRFLVPGTVVVLLATWTLLDAREKAVAPALKPDVGLVTRLSGEVTYAEEGAPEKSFSGEPFMKVRPGYRFSVAAKSVLQIVYFQNGRQETWGGPASLQVGTMESRGLTDGKDVLPELKTLPSGSASELRRIPALLDRAQKYGGTRVSRLQQPSSPARVAEQARQREEDAPSRGRVPAAAPPRAYARPPAAAPPKAAADPSPSPAKRDITENSEARIEKARETYRNLRGHCRDDDITPELLLIGVLAGESRYGEMEKAVAEALKRQPDNDALKSLQEWIRTQSSPRAPRP
jgi:hypothetical protein